MKLEEQLNMWEAYFAEADKKKKPYSSATTTTGNIGYGIDQFNKRMGNKKVGNDNNNPSTEEAKARRAATDANKAAGTVTAAMPDGSVGVSLGAGSGASGAGSGESCGGDCSGGGSGGGLGESFNLDEASMYVAKLDTTIDLPDGIEVIDKTDIEKALEQLEPEEEFTVGYITPIFFYKELADKFTLLKTTMLTGYTGVDYIEARANPNETAEDRAARVELSKNAIALGTKFGIHKDRKPLAGTKADFSAKYASTNKTVLQDNGNTLLFYPRVGSRPKVLYYLDFGKGYKQINRAVLEATILEYVRTFADDLISGYNKNGTPRKPRWDEVQLAAKIKAQLESDARTIEAVSLDGEEKAETRSRLSSDRNAQKPQVRALYTGQIYYIQTPYQTLGKPIEVQHDFLKEHTTDCGLFEKKEVKKAKRYVRRYYIRPQNKFASNKEDIINLLIDIGNDNCTVYTLNNLGDEKDVTKLTNDDIIYFYDDGILYDKNHMKIMDYDLYIKHEENRKKLDIDSATDAQISDVYYDRITGDMTESIDNELDLGFDDYNVYGEKLVEGKVVSSRCVICGEDIDGTSYNSNRGTCCASCYKKFIAPVLEEKNSAEEDA